MPPDPIDEPELALDDGLVLLDEPVLLLPLPDDMRAFVSMNSPLPELPVRSLALPAVEPVALVDPLAVVLPLLELLPLVSPDFRQPVTVTLSRSLSRLLVDDDDEPVVGV
jgi:hypothetical protein